MRHVLAMMPEVTQIQTERAVLAHAHDLAHGVEELWFAVGRQAHHLVFIAEVRKAKVLCERRIEDPERMRKVDASIDPDPVAASHPPGRAGKIAKAIHRQHHRFLEGRHQIGRGQMGQMMFHVMDLGPEPLPRKQLR
jgi:hypothetical protein